MIINSTVRSKCCHQRAFFVPSQDEARATLAELQALSTRRRVSPYDVAVIYVGLGDKEQAFTWLQKACAEHSERLSFLNVTPIFDGLRSDPRFTDLLRRVGLVQ